MSHNGTELHRHGDSEDRSNGDIHGTDGTDELPPLATKVSSLQEAVDIAVREEVPDKSQFILARALKAFEFTTGYKLKPGERDSALGLWWGRMQPHLPPDADFDECRLDFEALFTQIRSPLGANHFEESWKRARDRKLPAEAMRYSSPKIRLLVAVCFHLQRLAGTAPFFLSARDAAKVTQSSPFRAAGWLRALAGDGVLKVVEPGRQGGTRATRYRFNFIQPAVQQGLARKRAAKGR